MAIKRTRTELKLQFLGTGWRAKQKAPDDAGALQFGGWPNRYFATTAPQPKKTKKQLVNL
jgi:hypothetical protein